MTEAPIPQTPEQVQAAELERMASECDEMAKYLESQITILDRMMNSPSVAGSEMGVARAKMASTADKLRDASRLLR